MSVDGWQGFAVAALGLTLFEAVVSSPTATSNAKGITSLPALIVGALTDPELTIWGSKAQYTPPTNTNTSSSPTPS